MKKLILLNKKEGETPLEALEVFRKRHPKYKNEKMTYAGRLDPMAEGLLIILSGEETKNKEKYLALDKEYEFEVLFGFATDTYDLLGKVQHTDKLEFVRMLELRKKIKDNLKFFRGKWKQKYPLYSSKTIKQARAGEEVEAPEREVNVKDLKFLGIRKISSAKLLQSIEGRIKKVKGDFRQQEILKIWRKNLLHLRHGVYVGKFKIKCSSGTYVRGIAHELGGRMGLSALAFSIKRTKIGKWSKM